MSSTPDAPAATYGKGPARVTLDNNQCSIPAALRERRQWICWRLVHEAGAAKPRKVPLCPRTGRPASSTDPTAWATFDTALAALRTSHYTGLGFVFSADDPYTGVDLDACIEPDGTLTAWAADWLARLDSYSEYSPSGTGVHIIGRASLPAACKTPRAELYDRERFFTMTGRRVPGTPAAIHGRQDVVDDLLAELRPQPAHSATTAAIWAPSATLATPAALRERAAAGRIRRATLVLLDSTGPAGYPSASEADNTLACGLVGAGLTADEVLALILDSTRGQDAQRRKGERHAAAYWHRTVAHAARYVGPVLAPPVGPRVRLASGAAAAWRLAGKVRR